MQRERERERENGYTDDLHRRSSVLLFVIGLAPTSPHPRLAPVLRSFVLTDVGTSICCPHRIYDAFSLTTGSMATRCARISP
jgi:hypothetical protein